MDQRNQTNPIDATNSRNLINPTDQVSPTDETNEINQIRRPNRFAEEPFSSIEVAFQERIFRGEIPTELRQYGYSVFASPVSTFAPVLDVPVGPDYVLGPGDGLIINVWGAMEGAVIRTVDRNGEIILPSAGPVRVWGLGFSQAEKLIKDQLSRYYRGFETSVTMGRLRTIMVYVVGEVCQPGSYTISSLSTVTNALFAAGGPLKLGSLRDIHLKRNGNTVGTLDLYEFFLRGDKSEDFRLHSGDTIFVPTIGGVAAIAGEVKRPAIYEISGDTHVADLIEMGGGPTPRSYLKRVQIIRTKQNAEREVIDLDVTSAGNNGDSAGDTLIRNGDLVRVFPTDPRIYNTITLSGAVKHPGEYELKPGMRLSQLLTREALLPEAHPEQVEIARLNENLAIEVIQADLRAAWTGEPGRDVELQARDQIAVRSEYKTPFRVKLEGEIVRPGVYFVQPGERLSSVIKRAGGFTDKASLKGAVFTRRSVHEIERKRLDDFIRRHDERLLFENDPMLKNVSLQEQQAEQLRIDNKREQLRIIASRVTLGRVVIHLDELENFEGSASDLVLEDGDSLFVPQKPATVLVMGSVKNPTAIVHREDEDVQYYLNRAGGFSETAEPKQMYLLKADGSAITGFMRLRDVEPGDAVIVPPKAEKKNWTWLKDMATIGSQALLSFAALAAIL